MHRSTLLARRPCPVLLAGLLTLLVVASARESAAVVVPGCVPIPDEGPRESDAYRDPEPDASLRQAVARLQALDPHATVRFSDCEVDSFATRAKDTVPAYASRILRAAGLSSAPAKVELYPLPTLEPKPGQDLDGSVLLRHKLPLAEEAPLSDRPGETRRGRRGRRAIPSRARRCSRSGPSRPSFSSPGSPRSFLLRPRS